MEIEMPTTKTKTNPAEVHAQAVKAIGAWTTELEKARAELARLESTPAVDAATAKRQAADLATAREYAMRCTVALDAAIDRRDAAAAAVVEREAADLQPEIDKARAELAEHDRITKELLAPLVKHSGRQWEQVDPIGRWRSAGGDGTMRVKVSTREKLAGVLRGLERRQRGLRAAARGDDPIATCPEDELPESLLPGGIMPSPSLMEREAQAAEQEAAQSAHDAQVAQAQIRVDAAVASLGVDLAVTADTPESPWSAERARRWSEKHGITYRRQIMADVDAHHGRIAALELIAGLAGWDAGDAAAAAVIPAQTTTEPSGEDQ